jgi:hypothetical protein
MFKKQKYLLDSQSKNVDEKSLPTFKGSIQIVTLATIWFKYMFTKNIINR